MATIYNSTKELYEFDDFRVDVAERILWCGRRKIPLPEKAFETLVALLRHGNHLVSKDELLNEVWKDTIVEENNLAKNISLIRKALGLRTDGKEYVETVRGHGFRFEAEFHRLSTNGSTVRESQYGQRSDSDATPHIRETVRKSSVPGPISEGPEPIHDNRSKVKRSSRFLLVGLGFISLSGLILLAAYGWGERDDLPDRQMTSVAVLPFENAGRDAEMTYLSDGISETLIDKLSELPRLKVTARSSSFRFRGEGIDLQDAAKELGVQTLITGRIIRRGERISIRVELIDARQNTQIWGSEFDGRSEDLQIVQGEIAHKIAENLRIKLSGEQDKGRQFAVNPKAYELLLKGRFIQKKRDVETVRKASEFFSEAIAADPEYALAHALLSDTYSWLYESGMIDPKEFAPKAYAEARRSLELDPNLPDAHRVMAGLHQNDWNWDGAETEFKRAIQLNPNLAIARNYFSDYLSITGRHDEAIEEANRSKELDPLNIHSHITVAYALTHARRYDEAIAAFKRILEIDNNNRGALNWLAFAYTGKGMHREALEIHRQLASDDPTSSRQIYLGAAYAKAGKRDKARAILAELEKGTEFISYGELPVLYLALGETEKAFASLEKAYAVHDLHLQYLKIDSGFDPVRGDPRFQDLMRRVGLPG